MRHAPILIALALALATTARADGGRTLHLAVHGSLDGAALGQALATELGVDVALIRGTCDAPCLDVSIDGKHAATVVYVPRSGTPRARTIALGNDASQWPLVITLLAGNVVRDEAKDVLDALPPRALPRPAAPGPAVDLPPESDEATDEATDEASNQATDEAAGETAGEVAPPEAPSPADASPEPAPAVEAPAVEAPAVEAPAVEAPAVEARAVEAPPSVAPAEPEPEPEPAREHSFLGFGLVPGLSTDLTHIGSVRHFLSINLVAGVGGGSSGLSLSGIADIERGLAAGFQVAGVVAIARRVAGTQVAGVAAVSGQVDGLQIAGTTAVADRLDGIQAAGVAAVARRSAGNQVAGVVAFSGGNAGVQVGGVAAVARGSAGLQLAGVASVAGRDVNVQASGVASVARGTANIQIAGVVNVAHRVLGAQIAPINIARQVDGIQIGVINIGGSTDGFSFGLINIVPGGRYDLETAVDSNRTGTVLFRHGGRRWHNVYGVGGHPVKETGPSDDVWMYGLGFGPSLPFGDTVIDLEAIGWQVNHGPRHETEVSILGQLRLSIAHHWGPFALVAGGILNSYITSDPQSPLILERRTAGSAMTTGVTVTTWPSAFVGVRI